MKREDFLELKTYLGGNYEDAKVIAGFRDFLTPYGFEAYIADFFKQETYNFQTIVNGGYDDGGIDVKGIRREIDGSNVYLIVQCKRWSQEHIKREDVAKFYGETVDHKKHGNLFLVYATTTWATPNAKEFCEEKDILLLDYRKLLEMNREMDLDKWIRGKDKGEEYEKIATEWFRNRRKEEEVIQTETREDISELRKEIKKEKGFFGRLLFEISRIF